MLFLSVDTRHPKEELSFKIVFDIYLLSFSDRVKEKLLQMEMEKQILPKKIQTQEVVPPQQKNEDCKKKNDTNVGKSIDKPPSEDQPPKTLYKHAKSNSNANLKSSGTNPKSNESEPKFNLSKPKSNKGDPKANDSSPKSNESGPKFNESEPKSNKSKPKSNESNPKSNEVKSIILLKEQIGEYKQRQTRSEMEIRKLKKMNQELAKENVEAKKDLVPIL